MPYLVSYAVSDARGSFVLDHLPSHDEARSCAAEELAGFGYADPSNVAILTVCLIAGDAGQDLPAEARPLLRAAAEARATTLLTWLLAFESAGSAALLELVGSELELAHRELAADHTGPRPSAAATRASTRAAELDGLQRLLRAACASRARPSDLARPLWLPGLEALRSGSRP